MGCGQSKINLYPRRNKNGCKSGGGKKSGLRVCCIGAAAADADDEEGSAAGTGATEETEEATDADRGKHVLPLQPQPQPIEVSASQQDFFKMLDEKIDKGKDYDSSSDSEVRLEQDRRRRLIYQWRSASQSTQSIQSQPSPPTPARRRTPRPVPPERQHSPSSSRRCLRSGQHESISPPPRRSHSAQGYHQPYHETSQLNGDKDCHEVTKSPVKRPQSAGANWKSNSKIAPFTQKNKKNIDVNDNQRPSPQREYVELKTNSNPDVSQTYNPGYQADSPAHLTKTHTAQQPFIAQIVSYPMSQQIRPHSPPKYIAPPEEYQDSQNSTEESKHGNVNRQSAVAQVNPQSHIYYIHGNPNTNPAPDIVQQRQQTAIHLQQYVAMKQAQQQMFNYFQRAPHTVFPNVEYVKQRIYEPPDENIMTSYSGHTLTRPHSAPSPTPVGVVRPMPITPGINPLTDVTPLVHQMPMWTHMTPVVTSMGPWPHGQVPQTEVQYYHQAQLMQNMYRINYAGSAGTLTRYHKEKQAASGDSDSANSGTKNNVCQSINLVRQKPVGQIVSGGQDLTVCQNANGTHSSITVSSNMDGGVSPGNSGPATRTFLTNAPSSGNVQKDSSQNFSNPIETRYKKNKSVPLNTRSLKNSKSLDSSKD